MDLVTIIKAILPVEPSHLKTEKRSLNPGDYIVGRVIKVHGDGRVTMDFSEFKALTEVPLKVRAGQTLPLEIVKTGNPIKMRIIFPKKPFASGGQSLATDRPSSAALLKLMQQMPFDLKILEDVLTNTNSTASGLKNIQSALKALEALFSGINLNSDLKTLAADIQTRIENSGLFFEKKMAAILESLSNKQIETDAEKQQGRINTLIRSDFKPISLMLLEFLNTIDPENFHIDETTVQRIQDALKETLTDLEQQKNYAVKRFLAEDPLQIFHLVIPFHEKEGAVKFKLYYAKKQNGDSQHHPRVSLLLDLENLGPVRTDLLMINNDLSILFYVSDLEIKQYFENQLESIHEILDDFFNSVSLVVRVSEQKIEAFDGLPIEKDHEHKVDVLI